MIGHLNVYSCYSFQNSTILIKDLCKKASEMNLEAIALTDENNMYGAMEFYRTAKEYGIKPVLGVEASVEIDHEIYPFTLLAKDNQGYYDLVKIVSLINLDDHHFINIQSLSKYQGHLFVIAGNDSLIYRLIQKDMLELAKNYLVMLQDMFGDHFYIALLDHQEELQKRTNEQLLALAKLMQVKVCCSNEVRYIQSQDALALDLLRYSKASQTVDHMEVINSEKYLKSSYEMSLLFDEDIIHQTDNILRSCNVDLHYEKHLPLYHLEKGNTKDYLQQLCIVGLKKRFKDQKITIEYKERLKKELTVIDKMGFNDYFLIVFDYVRYAKKHGILVGPGRGSAAGSLVAYVLGITNVDPIEYNLFFERFLNEARVSMPDIDIDFQDDRRDEIVAYVTKKYGQSHVAQIVTFSTYGPRVAIKDLGKVVKVPLPALERIAKCVPTNGKERKSVREVYETSYSFVKMIDDLPELKRIIPAICLVEHLPRNISMHAAGVVLSGDDLQDIVPLTKGPNHNIMTQYSKNYIEGVGLLKMDFLGLKNLTIIGNIIKEVEANTHQVININTIDLDDEKTYSLIANGDTFGVFQLESRAMTNLVMQLKVKNMDDIISAIALYRPGPKESIPLYVRRRFHQEKITYPLECLKDILEPTNGILIYQEQIMQVAQRVAGFTLSKADSLRKAISSKDAQFMEKLKNDFIQGSLENGFPLEQGQKMFALIEKFADYGLNKSHAVAYAIIAYQLAYLKAHYPLEFYCAILTNDQSSERNKMMTMKECKKYGIKILPPSVNKSLSHFSREDQNIRFSLLAIKGFGQSGYLALSTEREKGPFKDIYDFFGRMHDKLTSHMIDHLIYAGALDEFKQGRLNLIENYQAIIQFVTMNDDIGGVEPPIFQVVKEDPTLRLEQEKQVLGVYLSHHPIAMIKKEYSEIVDVSQLDDYIGKNVNVIIQITRVKLFEDKKGQSMCFVEGNDDTGSIEGVVFGSVYPTLKDTIVRGNIVYINGKINFRDRLSLVINKATIRK